LTSAASTPRLTVALRVIAGRATARGCAQLSLLLLLPVWGAAQFGSYVAAIGAFSWLAFAVTGVEKAALTMLPRTRILGTQCTRMLLGRAAAPLFVAVLATVALIPVGGAPALYAASAAFAAGQGLLSTLASVHRLAGRPERDSRAFACFSAWVAAAAGLAVAGVLSPYGYVLALVAGVTLDCAVLALLVPALRRRPAHARAGRRLGVTVSRRVILLGLSDVADNAGVSVLYLVLATTLPPADATLVYLTLLISGALGLFGVLVLRLLQPATSLRLRGAAGALGRRRARRITGWAAVVTISAIILATVGALAAYSIGGRSLLASIGSTYAALGAAVAVEMTAFCAVAYAGFLLENTNGAVLSLTSTAAVTGLTAVALAALLVIPILHAVGAVLALVIGLATKCTFLTLRLRGRSPTGSWRDRVTSGAGAPSPT
jgi:hypothetical protein